MFRIAISLVLAASLAACMPPPSAHHGGEWLHDDDDHDGHHGSVPIRAPDPQLEEAARHVRVMARNDLGCTTEVVGLVDVHESMETTEAALMELKMRAAELGGEAVVGTDFEHGEGHGPTHLSGMAVRCRDLVHGRAYDVLGTVEVDGAMDHEDDAFERIKERARTMHADLLLDVRFDHGEGEHGPTKLRGTAIRFRPGERRAQLSEAP